MKKIRIIRKSIESYFTEEVNDYLKENWEIESIGPVFTGNGVTFVAILSKTIN